MKLTFRNIEPFLKKPPADIAAVLVYGPDEGLVLERFNALSKTVVSDLQDAFGVAEFTGAQLAEKPSLLMDEALSISMLGGRRVVRVRDADDKISPAVKDMLAALKSGGNLVLIEAGNLGARSSLRLLFEGADNAAALPCYVEDERDISRVIAEGVKAEGCSISPDALSYMAANIIGDRGVARSEIVKLITYMGSDKRIELDDVTAAIGDSAQLSLDDLCRHAGLGQFEEAERVLRKLLSEDVSAVRILRVLQDHFAKIHLAKSRMQQGDSLEGALAKIRPPLFFKVKPSFEAQVASWPIAKIEQILALLGSAEARCKQTASDPETLCSRALLSVTQAAKAGRKRA